MKRISSIQFITQPTKGKSHAELANEACSAGIDWIQLRLKNADDFIWEQEAVETWEVCQEYGATFIVNDNVEVAQRVNADGVHLGKNDMSPKEARAILGDDKIIGGTANTFEDIKKLRQQGVDYIGLGPLRFTETKNNLSPTLGFEGYENIIQQLKEEGISTPIIGIGGIVINDIQSLKKVGVKGIALSGLLAHSDNMKNTFQQIKDAWNK